MEEMEVELKERRQKRRAFYSGLHRSKPKPKKEEKEKRVKECGFKKRNNNTNYLSGKKKRKELREIMEGVVSSKIENVKQEIKEKDEYKFVKIIDASECSPTASLPKIKPKSYKDGAEGMIKWCNDFVRIPIYPEGSDMAEWVALKDLPDDPNPRTRKSSKQFWENIQSILRQALIMENGRFVHRLVVLCWMRGEAKCEKKGSKVLMYNGSIRKVEDVHVGDFLMGDDNTPRKVLSLVNGTEEMFEVIPNKGETLTVTGDHILSLKKRAQVRNRGGVHKRDGGNGTVVDISVNDYKKQTNCFKNNHMLFRVPIEFPEQKIKIDPYFLGIWLGDGTTNETSITTMDKVVVDHIEWYAKELGQTVSFHEKKGSKASTYRIVGSKNGLPGSNHLLNLMREYNLIGNKHIPKKYKVNSRENRMQLLAGLIDSDGSVNRNSFCIVTKRKVLCDDILFLARSLGFHAEANKFIGKIKSLNFEGEYYKIGISGDCSIIPTKKHTVTKRSDWKSVLVSNIKEIRSVGEQEYYGFTLDGNGRYVRGDFTVTHNSLVACLIQLWKFFNWPRQQIMLGANSKDQVKFVHFDIIRDIILNSPDLLFMIGGERNIQEKEVRIVDEQGHVKSMIRSISSFSGIVSNITGYTFSEIFDMKNPKFFVQLDGSIRNIPNALGVIDSTVSAKDHILYRLYTNYISNKTSTVFFSYRYSRKGIQEDYWNPNMDNAQLDDYRTKFPFGEFERYFLNMWNAGGLKVFNEEMFFETNVIGADGYFLNHETIQQILDDRKKSVDVLMDLQEKKRDNFDSSRSIEAISSKIKVYESRLQLVDSIYELKDSYSRPKICTAKTLCAIGDMFKTDFSIHVGLDLSDPFAKKHRARSIVTCVAKGLANSRDNIFSSSMDAMSPRYIYFLLALDSSEMYADKSLERIKDFLEELDMEYDGLDTLCSERYGAWDMSQWCEERNVTFEPVHPNYDRQKEAFNELYLVIDQGRFKSPKIIVPGTKDNNILKEELLMFDHDSQLKWFGSPEKADSHGVQDDSVFSLMWCIYGGRFTTSDQFRMRNSEARNFGTFMQTEKLIGRY
jgi:hypothetical protein